MKNTVILLLLCSLAIYGQSIEQTQLTLKEALSLALEKNGDILNAEKGIKLADAKILQAGRIANAEISLETNEIPTSLKINNTGELNLWFSQGLEFFGKRGLRIDAATQDKFIAEVKLTSLKTILASKIKTFYYNALLTKEIISNIEFNIQLLSDFLQQVTDKYRAGTSEYIDIIRTKVELTRLKNSLFETKRNHRVILNELKYLIGMDLTNDVALIDSLNYKIRKVEKDSLLQQLAQSSNFLKQIEYQSEKNKYNLELANKNKLPDFKFGIALQKRNVNGLGSYDQFIGLSFGLSLPMFYSPYPKGEIQEAETLIDISKIQREYFKKKIMQNISNSYYNLVFAQEQLNVFETSLLNDAEEELRTGINSYQNNKIDVLNLFDIYRTYRATKFEYLKTIYNNLVAEAELEASGELQL